MDSKISQESKREVLRVLRERYKQASKLEKTKILDEFVAIAKCHRKHAIRLLMGAAPVRSDASSPGRRIYSEAVRQALIVLWEAADRICGKRLKMILPSLITAMVARSKVGIDTGLRVG